MGKSAARRSRAFLMLSSVMDCFHFFFKLVQGSIAGPESGSGALQRRLRLQRRRQIGAFQDAEDTAIVVLQLREGLQFTDSGGASSPAAAGHTCESRRFTIQLV